MSRSTLGAEIPASLLGADVLIEHGSSLPSTAGLDKAPVNLPGGGMDLWVSPDRAVARFRTVGWFEVADGGQVHVIPDHPGVSPVSLMGCLHGVVAALVLAQQGRFALHASTVEIDGCRVAVSGSSGAGKSTTALALVQRGATPVADDVTVVEVVDGVATTESFGRHARVARDTAARLGIDLSAAGETPGISGKAALDWPPAPRGTLDILAIIQPADVSSPVVEFVSGLAALAAIAPHSYFWKVFSGLYPGELFAWRAQVADAVQVVRIRRPDTGWTVPQVAELIEELAQADVVGA